MTTVHEADEGSTRLMAGSADPARLWEYGRLEIFMEGYWSNVCSIPGFNPAAAQVACRALGYDGGAAIRIAPAYANTSPVEYPAFSTVRSSVGQGIAITLQVNLGRLSLFKLLSNR